MKGRGRRGYSGTEIDRNEYNALMGTDENKLFGLL